MMALLTAEGRPVPHTDAERVAAFRSIVRDRSRTQWVLGHSLGSDAFHLSASACASDRIGLETCPEIWAVPFAVTPRDYRFTRRTVSRPRFAHAGAVARVWRCHPSAQPVERGRRRLQRSLARSAILPARPGPLPSRRSPQIQWLHLSVDRGCRSLQPYHRQVCQLPVAG